MSVRMLQGDVRAMLATLAADSVHCVITSVPYWGLRAYGTEPQVWGGAEGCAHEWGNDQPHGRRGNRGVSGTGGNLHPTLDQAGIGAGSGTGGAFCTRCNAWRGEHGQEPTPALYVAHEVEIWRAVRRVLRPDGIAWLNIGDTYAGGVNGRSAADVKALAADDRTYRDKPFSTVGGALKPKDLCLIPERLAIALQDDGWWIRSRVPWCKRSAMPDSTTDRPGVAVEYFWKMTKSGTTKFWTHRDLDGRRRQPAPDYRWRDGLLGGETSGEPQGWRDELLPAVPGEKRKKRWTRVNLWRGHDYFWDAAAVRQAWADDRQGKNGARGVLQAHPQNRQDAHQVIDPSALGGRNFRDADLLFQSLAPPHGLISDAEGMPLALDVNTAGYPGAHFATFPPKLIEPLIKASTSERGCCPACGAPWVRVVESTPGQCESTGRPKANLDGVAKAKGYGNPKSTLSLSGSGSKEWAERGTRTKTLDWRPSCACPEPVEGPVPCTVLDPFGGAGTTGLVADRLGRDAVLIELQPDYAEMARRRIAGDAPLFAEVT